MYYFLLNFNDSNNHDNNYDINNNSISSPSLNESNDSNDFVPQSDELNNNNYEFNNSEQFNNDNLLSRFPFGNDELNSFDDEHLPIQQFEPPHPYIPNEVMTTAAVTQMPANPEISVQRTPIFEIKKVKHKFIGRRRKNKIYTYKAEHTKKETKNMLTKIKKASYNNYLDLINNNIKDSKDEEIRKRNIKLRKVSNSIIGVSSREDNLDLIKLNMKDILSSPLSNNHKRFDKNYNKKAIDFILNRKDEKLISNLNKSFEDVIRIYADDLTDKNFDSFKTIKDDINLKEDSDLELEELEYIKTYKAYAKNYKETFMNIDGRSPRKKKIN
jgi:hypothetical protein